MKGLKFFSIGFLLGLPLWVGLNFGQSRLEDFFLSQFYLPSPEVALAQISKNNFLDRGNFDLEAKSVLVLKLGKDGNQQILFAKNAESRLPIASLVKLMTAVVSLENQTLSQKVEITKTAVSQEGSSGGLRIGEKIEVGELIKMALVESSNDAAEALAELDGRSQFIELMNLKAGELGLFSTHFSTPTGLEAEDNFSTVKNLAVLSAFILREHPLIFSISAQPSVIILSENDRLHHRAFNTNELLTSLAGFENLRMVGGKTGYTQEAGGCIVLLTENPAGDYFINILLGAGSTEARFAEMRKLVEAFN